MGSDRAELVRLCRCRNWSKAIHLLDSLLARSPSIHDLFNRAFCYSQLELHKHVVKDCDRALELDPALLQAYVLKAADSIGKKIQYNCRGFLLNQHQKNSKAWRFLRNPKNNAKFVRRRDKLNMSQNRGGYCSSSTLSGTPTSRPSEDKISSGISLSWHDVYNIAVKWRKFSEPCDPVIWINKLSEEFNSGFGSHTPMLLGQAKIIRYYPYYQRVLEAAKNIMLDLKYFNDAGDRAVFLTDIEKMKKIEVVLSCSDLYHIVGEAYWVWISTRCDSIVFQGRRLEWTGITTQNMYVA
ncbi:hypothetical protein ABZP36_002527 [Zizania latifolia]